MILCKKCKTGKGNLCLTENRLSKNEMCCETNNHNDTCHTCPNGLLDSNFNEVAIDKISIFHEITPNITYSQKL